MTKKGHAHTMSAGRAARSSVLCTERGSMLKPLLRPVVRFARRMPVLGALPGILSVYLGRSFEWLSLRLVDTLIALPFLVFAVAVTALLGNGIPQAMLTVEPARMRLSTSRPR